MIMKCVNERRVDQYCGPEHRSRLNQIFPHKPSDTEANALRRNCQKQVEPPTKILPIEASLSYNGVCKVPDPVSDGRIGHDNDEAMLLHIEGAGVETPFKTKGPKCMGRHDFIPTYAKWIGDQLNYDGSDS